MVLAIASQVALVGLAWGRVSGTPPNLLQVARAIARTTQWTERPTYQWLDKDRVVYVEGTAHDTLTIPPGRRFNRLAMLDLRTKRRTALTAINRRWREAGDLLIDLEVPAPDAAWLLLRDETPNSDPAVFVTTSWDGRRWVRHQPVGWFFGGVAWSPDSKTCYAVGLHGGRLHWWAVDPAAARSPSPSWGDPQIPLPDGGADGNSILGMLPDGRLVMALHRRRPAEATEIVLCRLAAGAVPTVAGTFQTPRGRHVAELAMSPRGDRLAWLVAQAPADEPDSPRPKQGEPSPTELWVTDLDCTAKRLAGAVRRYWSGSAIEGWRGMQALRWRPLTDEISFVYRETLYLARVR